LNNDGLIYNFVTHITVIEARTYIK